jgi:hypothetical protein
MLSELGQKPNSTRQAHEGVAVVQLDFDQQICLSKNLLAKGQKESPFDPVAEGLDYIPSWRSSKQKIFPNSHTMMRRFPLGHGAGARLHFARGRGLKTSRASHHWWSERNFRFDSGETHTLLCPIGFHMDSISQFSMHLEHREKLTQERNFLLA